MLFRCEICGDPYIGDEAPKNCPFCGARDFMKKFDEAQVNFDLELNDNDEENVRKALDLELSNAAFYLCSSKSVDDLEGQKLFKALGKVEAEHASVWKKILKVEDMPDATDRCSDSYRQDLEDSHEREDRAIKFYMKAAEEAEDERIRQIFNAFVEVEKDHLALSEERLR